MLREKINEMLKEAMKAKDQARVSTLRMINAGIKEKDIAARTETSREGISDDAVMQMMQTMVRQRRDSIAMYEKGGRADLVQKELDEIALIESFLPKQMSDDDLKAAALEIIKELGVSGQKEMGKVMGALKTRFAGQIDLGKASALVKGLLTT